MSNSQVSENPGQHAKPVLWVITELYYPENNQTGYYMTGIAEGLAEDFDVRVICGQPNYAARGTLAPKTEFHRGVEIERVWGTTLDKNVILFRLINMLTLGISIFVKSLLEIKKGQTIIVVSAPPTLPFIAALAAKIRRANYNLIVQDKYPETLIAVGKTNPNSIFVKIFNRLNGWLYRGAERVIVVGRDMQELVAAQTEKGRNQKPEIKVIQNWASLEEVEPMSRQENVLLKELGIADKLVFLYAGNMGHPQDLESIIECAEKLKDDTRFHFLFLGSGVKKKWLEATVEGKKLANVTVLPPRPRSEQKIFLNACDVGLVSLVKGMRGVAMPSRTYNFLAAGKPILALTEENSEVARVIEEDGVGWYAPPAEPVKLLDLIYKIYDSRDSLEKIGRRATNAALDKYSVETAVHKYRRLFANASDNGS